MGDGAEEAIMAEGVLPAVHPKNWKTDDRTIHMRMIDVLAELPAIGKTDYNEVQKFHFRSHDSVLNAANPLLAKHGVICIPEVLERIAEQRTTSRGSTMYEVNLHMRFTFWGAQGDSVVASTWGEGTDMGDKATNKAMTMAFKAVLAQSFAVSTEEGYDTDRTSPEETTRGGAGRPAAASPPSEPKIPAAKSWKELTERLTALGVPAADSAEWFRQAKEAALLDVSTDAGKLTLFQGANKFLIGLTKHGEVAFENDPRPALRKLLAEAFNLNAEPEGPVWRLSPTEENRPTHEEHEKAIADLKADLDEAAATAPPDPDESDDIPF